MVAHTFELKSFDSTFQAKVLASILKDSHV